VIFTENDTSYH